MDPRFSISREDLYNLQMEVKQVQFTQANHADRILRVEKRQADDSALKSVWNSPFPGVLAGTPQHGPVQIPQNDMFDDLDEQGEQLLGSLHLGPAEEEPVRRGAASRANSVRFDESALHGSSWGGQNNRHSGDFGPIRPGNGFMMERTLSHKSDGRHSSAGHSVHSHHSVASGRASSLGLDTNYATGDDDDSSSFEIPPLPASLYVLGTVPAIVRCWLTTNYAHGTLLYADICTGSQKSTIDYFLVKELDLLDDFQRDPDGIYRGRLDVYLAEAVITRHGSRSGTLAGSVPSITVTFEMNGGSQSSSYSDSASIRIYIGSDALRAHSADVLFSQNTMVLYGNDRDRLRVPFVRPENENAFRHIYTTNIVPEKPKLNANAAPFVVSEITQANGQDHELGDPAGVVEHSDQQLPISPMTSHMITHHLVERRRVSNPELESSKGMTENGHTEAHSREALIGPENSRREPSTALWGSWRHGTGNNSDGHQRENEPLSGYQPAGRPGRNMKVLKSLRSGSASARTGASYEPPLPPKSSGEGRRKSQVSASGESVINGGSRWDIKKMGTPNNEPKSSSSSRESRNTSSSTPAMPRSANPVGVASAFSWMTPTSKTTKTPVTFAD